jgi:acyl carrier protein
MTINEEAIEALCKKAADLFGGQPSDYNENTRFVEDLHCKSVNYVQFSAVLEDVFDTEVSYMEFVKMKTFAEAGEYMREKIEG